MDLPEAKTVAIAQAIAGRRSVRRFLPAPVPLDVVRDILRVSARAPSGTNSQPWLVHVATGAARDRLCATVEAAARAGERAEEYPYNPHPWFEPYVARRRKVGFDLYALLGVARDDMKARGEAALRNFTLFGAPVGLIFTMDRRQQLGSWLDCGMFMQNVMTMARAHGLETCPQAAWCSYGPAVRRALPIPDGEIILSGMALGFEDTAAPENALKTEREPVDRFATFHDA
ncbi:MAG: nitroreductase [Alphaproteobacteria bacterium]|nr:nitroreductase [Alphaproteobacteria bacterium]